ncbi:hypothetical protein IAT40_006819 [Kwoniella sp. CBS 6097]
MATLSWIWHENHNPILFFDEEVVELRLANWELQNLNDPDEEASEDLAHVLDEHQDDDNMTQIELIEDEDDTQPQSQNAAGIADESRRHNDPNVSRDEDRRDDNSEINLRLRLPGVRKRPIPKKQTKA